MLRRRGAITDPREAPFRRRRTLFLRSVPVVRVKLQLCVNSMMWFTLRLSGTNRNNLQVRPQCLKGVICYCKVDKHRTNLFFGRETIFNFLGEKGNWIYSRSSMTKTSLLVWKQGVNYGFDSSIIGFSKILNGVLFFRDYWLKYCCCLQKKT